MTTKPTTKTTKKPATKKSSAKSPKAQTKKPATKSTKKVQTALPKTTRTKATKTTKTTKTSKVISDYNGYDYKKIFWEDADREYEDLADRLAIRRLLPEKMDNFVDIAGGYGRLAAEYIARAKKSTIFDYSKTELDQAKAEFGDRINVKQGDIYALPFKDGEFDSLIMVRATHHFKDMDKVVKELARILEKGGTAVIEVANKKTLPRIIRYWTKKTDQNPFTLDPVNLKDVDKDGFYNYHPRCMEQIFEENGFKIEQILSVSNFRSPKLKKFPGTKVLNALEKPAQYVLAPVRFAPSIYYRLVKK